MSWVRVESFKGVRFSAPSFSQPPELEGFDRFFCSPHRMRTLHCFPPVRQAYRGENEVTVIFDQVDFGGRLGEVTIAVGDSSPSEAGLSVLMDAVIAALRSTNEAGVRAVLDGLCTLPPTVEERHAMTTVLEEDGIPRPLPLSHADTNSAHCSGERGNQEYMQKILSNANVARSNGNSGDRRHSSSAESMSNGYSSTSMLATSPALSSPDVLSHAEALRRKALLYFVAENVVPLSLLNCNVQLDRRKLATNTSITTPGDDRTLAGSMDATSLAPPPLIPTVVAHRCTSRLEKSEVLNRPQSFWRQIAVDASDSASRLVLALNRTLCGAFPGNDELFCRTMWRTDNPECSLENTPVVAAFSPSGLLLASPLFTTELEHRDRLIISAIAIDRLSRAGSLVEQESRAEDERGPASARLDAERRSCAILFLHLPFTIGVQVVELSFMTVGDSLCLVTGISQTLQRSRGLHITNIADLVRQNCSCFSSFKDSASFRCPLAANLSFQNDSLVTPLDHVINVCCNCTQPSSPHFFNSILVLTAMEENLADDVVGNSSLFEQLLLGDRDKFAADDIVRSTLPTERKKAKGLAKFLQCLPFCGRNSTSSWKKASQKLSAIRKKVHLFSDENTLATRSLDGDEVSLPKYQRQRRLSAVTSIPVHTSWCYVAAIYTRSELAAFRPLEGLGAHSIFWLTRSVDALAGGPSAKTKAANLPSLRLGQYALSFFRPQLQVITTSCADASMEIVHNPVLTLTMSSTSQGGGLGNTTPAQATTTPATGASAGASSAPAPADADDAAAEGGDAPLTFHAQVTLLPVELLEEEVCAPATADRTTGMDADGGNESIEDSESGFDDDDNVAAVDSADMLLTTFFLRYQQKMRSSKRARPRAAGGAGAGPSNASFSTERRASLSSASAAVMEDEKAGATGGTGTSSGKNKEKSKAPQKKGVISSMVGFGGDQGESYSWVTIEEIINLHGYLLGDEECIVASLQRRSAAVDKASRPKDGTLTELESSPQVRKLSEQLVLCQEAAHTMFEDVVSTEREPTTYSSHHMQPDRDDTTDDAPVAAPGVVAGGGADALPTRIEDLYAMLCNMEDQRQEEELALCAAQKEHECLGRRLAETQAEHQAHASTLKLLQQRCEEEQPLTDSACAECVVAESALPGMQHQLQQAEDALLQLCDTELSACSAMFAATSAADCHPSEVREAKATLHSLSMKLQRAVELLPRESETPTTTVMEETQNNTPRVLSEEGAADVPARPSTHKRVTFAEDLVEVILIPPCGSFLRTPTSKSVPRLPMAFRGGMPSRSALRKPREDALEEANSNLLCEEAAGPTSNAASAGAPPRTLLRVPIGLKRSHETPSVEHANHVAAGDVHSGDATENEDAAGVAIHSGDAAELMHMVRYPLQLQRGTALRTMIQRRKMRTTWRFSSADN